MTVTFSDYNDEYIKFALKHNAKSERREYTSLVNGIIHKTVCWEDGATWWEVTETEYSETVEIEVHGVKAKVNVPLRKTEYWSTESGSKYFYERA